ncbi:MAG: T9SS type A sorting domain-containing protein, partial [Clostridiales bacterium]
GDGLARYDGTNWAVYNTSNSSISNNTIQTIMIDREGRKWLATLNGVSVFDGTNWKTFTPSNSPVIDPYVRSLAMDSSGVKWIGTFSGLLKYDDTTFTLYNRPSTGLPGQDVITIAIDEFNNKWIGTNRGLAAFNESGIVTEVKKDKIGSIPGSFSLLQNYPNPFNPVTTISYYIPQKSNVILKVYDILGKEIKTLVKQEQSAGSYKVQFDGNSLGSGIYLYRLSTESFSDVKKLILLK